MNVPTRPSRGGHRRASPTFRSAIPLLSLIIAVAATACGGGSSGDGAASAPPPPGGGAGGVTLTFDAPAPVVIPDYPAGTLRIDTRQLNVRRSADIIFSASFRDRDFDPFTGNGVDASRDVIVALDYGDGTSRELVRREPRSALPLVLLPAGERLFVSAFGGGVSTFLTEIARAGGPPVSQTELLPLVESCLAVVGGDFYFASFGEYQVARGFADAGVVAETQALQGEIPCDLSTSVAELDGALVTVTYPTAADPDVDMLRVRELDRATGELGVVLLERPAAQFLYADTFREPRVALAADGVYVLSYDRISLEVHYFPYNVRPGGTVEDRGADAQRLARIEMPFFANVPPPGGTLSVERIEGFAATEGLITLGLTLEETASDGRFLWRQLVVIDASTGRADLLQLATSLLDMRLIGDS
jgi:hypothetical protein